ncbi:DHS-like NAD/FAD-binding domain-containing protein [Biscogniauxia marginata]|nr:DHS-like NAD/FAD-binding domain-containing protein [Biscogniauxia marginata]
MGQETSHPVPPDTPPQTLSDRSLAAVADLIKSGRAKRIVVMTGAGISTAAGIPDFRSPKTGLYHNLARLSLPHPEAVFDIGFFRENPRPFYVLAKELYPGNFHPTISHVFIALLAKKKLLRMLFTQNIDCLERAAGVPSELIIEAHGSFATQRCIECKTPFPDKEMREHVERGDPPLCTRPGCNGLVKPDIVFFGERLPDAFYAAHGVPAQADLVLVLGTSLTVHPFAGLPLLAREGTPRLLLNMERVGDLGTRADDVLHLGECDAGVRALADELGWRDELEDAWTAVVGEEEARRQRGGKRGGGADAEDEVLKLAKQVEDRLELSSEGGDDDDADANLGTQDEVTATAATTIHSEASPARGAAGGTAGASPEEGLGDGEARDEKKDEDEGGKREEGWFRVEGGENTAREGNKDTATATAVEKGEPDENKNETTSGGPVANSSTVSTTATDPVPRTTDDDDSQGKKEDERGGEVKGVVV